MQIRHHIHNVNPALVLHPSGQQLSFSALERRANQLAHYLRRAGLREGDTVAVVMENNAHLHAVMWAARRCGLYYALINTHLTAGEAAYISSTTATPARSSDRTLCAPSARACTSPFPTACPTS
jgi:fatty-acyl-CoA synthase